MTNKIKTPSQQIGKNSVKKIKNWLKTSPKIPIHNRKMNKAGICRMHKITKSTLDSNRDLELLFADDGPIALLVQEQLKNTIEKQVPLTSKVTSEGDSGASFSTEQLTQKIDELKQTIDSIHLDLASEEYLASTGRYIPKLYLKSFES